MTTPSIDKHIAQVNRRLKAAQLGFQIERRGQKLSLRGTLPPRPGSTRLRSHQQRISLGLSATPAGLKQAEQEAKIIAVQLIQKSFNWQDYLSVNGEGRLSELSLAQQLQAFEQDFFKQRQQRHAQPAAGKTTWESAYAPYLRKLVRIAQANPNLSLTEALYATVRATTPNSRGRQACCTALGALAVFLCLDLPINLKSFWGGYSPSRTQARDLPSDALIAATYSQIPNPAWRFVYGVMATYGLRNHEVFCCDYSALAEGNPEPTIQVLSTTKTGSHEVWPFYPEWIEQFNLRQVCLPAVSTDLAQTTLQRMGQRVTQQFQRYKLPFSPYDLRHAWAVRTIHFGLPDTVAARMMGHSVSIHTRTYHRWIARRDQQQAVAAALSRRQLTAPLSSGVD
ncbi:MAG TPA: site-specific integrase [Candidatus Caenarcaniphilales bacterium]